MGSYRNIVAFVLLSFFITSNALADVLVINDTNSPPFTTPAGDGFLDIVAHKMFALAGLELKLIKTPPERALRNVNADIDDGELTRIAGINKVYPNLVRVPEKIVDWDFVALCRVKECAIKNWQDLKKYNVGFIRGWKILENNTKGFPKITLARNPQILFNMLEKKRIDVALYAKWMGLAIIKEKGIQGVQVMTPPLASREMFVYLHKKHAKHVPKLAQALKSIKASGEYDQLFKQKVIHAVKQKQ